MAETLWSLVEGHGIDRIVIELEDSTMVSSYLIGQLILLHKRSHLSGGVVRLCGFSSENYRVIEQMRLGQRFPNYETREDAVMGWGPRKPR